MEQKSPIAIIGCGWLGLPLAKQFVAEGHTVHGSTTSEEKLAVLALEGIRPFLLDVTSEGIAGQLKACLEGCKILVLNIPPGLRKNPEQDYVGEMQQLLPHIENSSVEQLVFIGSTSVYADDENMPVITEASTFSRSETAQKLVTAEGLFQQNNNFNATILRLSGLIGPNRHPATYLSGRNQIQNPEAPVNLIHRDDAIAIIKSIISQKLWNEAFNASFPSHPAKKEFYTKACEQQNLPLPQFDEQCASKGKTIASNKLLQRLKFEFEHQI
jgi:nucleoside-diphosphate-sugar epimerase